MVRKYYSYFFIIGVFMLFSLFVFSFVSANDILRVETDIYRFPEIVEIDVQDYIYLGNVTIGFQTKPTSNDKIIVKNTGTFNVSVQPRLVNTGDPYYSNLYFTKRLSGEDYEYYRVGDFEIDIPWSGEIGKETEEYFYAKLDLRNMSNIQNDLIGYTGDVIFYAFKD